MPDDFLTYLDRWLLDQDVTLHSTTMERIADGAEEFFTGRKRTFDEWCEAPNG